MSDGLPPPLVPENDQDPGMARSRRALPWVEVYEAPAAAPWWPVNAAGLYQALSGDHRGVMIQRVGMELAGPQFFDLLLSLN